MPNPWSHYRNIYEIPGTSHLEDLIKLIPQLSWSDRKTLMTLARARCYPRPNTVLFSLTGALLKRLHAHSPMITQQIEYTLSSAMLSGFFLSLLLSAPYERQDVQTIKNTLMWKEVSVMESTPRTASIDWYALFSPDSPLHESYAPSSCTNRRVRSSLRNWVSKCRSQIIYPSMGIRSVSSETRKMFEQSIQQEIPKDIDVTSSMIEHYYSRTGIRLQGRCQMKQKWYPTQSSPRTYFAQGGHAYHTSKYLRDPFNWLCDSFYPTNRYNRVSPSGIAVDLKTDEVYIYDLTSFTSLFHEQRSFLSFLSDIMQEVDITIFDSWEGPLTVSLGSLIQQYLEANVLQPGYTTDIPILSDLDLVHSVAGFLGVFGNLATCTYPHGVCLSTVYDKPDDCWCAGDDAGTKESNQTKGRMVHTTAESIGSIAVEKTFLASQPGAVALKRPITVLGGLLYQRPNILWPIFAVMCDEDPRFVLPDCKHTFERVTGAIVSFLRSCRMAPLSPSDIEFAYSFFSHFYRRFHLPESGWYPPLTGYDQWSVTIPRMSREVFGKDPLQVLVDSFFGTEYVAGFVDSIPWDNNLPELNTSFVCNTNQYLNYIEKLGYVTKEVILCVYPGLEGKARARLDIDHPNGMSLVYQYRVIEHLPDSLKHFSLE